MNNNDTIVKVVEEKNSDNSTSYRVTYEGADPNMPYYSLTYSERKEVKCESPDSNMGEYTVYEYSNKKNDHPEFDWDDY